MNKYDQFVGSQSAMREHLLDVAKQRDFSMMAMAKLIGISRNTLMYFVKGERYLSFKTLGKIEKFLEKYDAD